MRRNQTHVTLPAFVNDAAKATTTKPSPAKSKPTENFTGSEGWRRPILTHSHAKTGAKPIIIRGFTACNQLAGNSQPKMVLFVSFSANALKLVLACSKPIQKTIEKQNSTKMVARRFQSVSVSLSCIPVSRTATSPATSTVGIRT